MLIPAGHPAPVVSIITAYDATRIEWLRETAISLLRMTFTHWEWLIVYASGLAEADIAPLTALSATDSRIHAIPVDAASPLAACSAGAQRAEGRFFIQLDSGDQLEPTFVEKALWVLEAQPHYAACDAYVVEFGAHEGFHDESLQEIGWTVLDHRLPFGAVVRREAWDKIGGYQESDTLAQARQAFWYAFAQSGLAAYTVTEYLVWRRTAPYRDARDEQRGEDADQSGATAYHAAPFIPAATASPGQASGIAELAWERTAPDEAHFEAPSFSNPLIKPDGVHRTLIFTATMVMGGADRFNLDLLTLLPAMGYEFTLVTTMSAMDGWMEHFTNRTPDVFRLSQFLDYADYPRFIDYLIESRHIDTILINNSEVGYALAPYLQTRHPHVSIVDFCHAEEEWRNGGYPAMSLASGRAVDLNLTCTAHLREWMTERGGDPERIDVVYCNVDTAAWRRDHYDPSAVRARWSLPEGVPVLLYVGRISQEKRPGMVVDILKRLAAQDHDFIALVVGSGPELDHMKQAVRESNIEGSVRFLGVVPALQVRELMSVGDILLLPSAREGLALVLYECMAMSVVPVAADVGGQAELVTQDCGYLVAPGQDEIDRYVAACVEILQDPERRHTMASNARRRVVEQFDLSQTVTNMVEAFRRARALADGRERPYFDIATARSRVMDMIRNLHAEALIDDLRQEVMRQSQGLADMRRMDAELRQWGADQAALIATYEKALEEQRVLLADAQRASSPAITPGEYRIVLLLRQMSRRLAFVKPVVRPLWRGMKFARRKRGATQ